MKLEEVPDRAREAMDIHQVFGEPIESGGVTVIPVARVSGGGGGGVPDQSGGVGYGFRAEPAGVYVIQDGKVRWEPAVNANKLALAGMFVGVMGIVTAPRILKQIRKIIQASD